MALVITDRDVERLLSMRECIDAMKVAFKQFAEGTAVSSPRLRYTLPSSTPGYMYWANIHVGAVPAFDAACVRAGSSVGQNVDENRRGSRGPTPARWGIITLYSLHTGEPLAFIHESYLSGIRVGATSAVAVDVVAPVTASTLGLLGTGKQARAHLDAIRLVRPIQAVHVYSPNPAHLEEFVRSTAIEGVQVIAEADPRDVVSASEVVCCATNSLSPVLFGHWLHPGQVVISIANSDVNSPKPRSEVDADTIRLASSIVVNDRESIVSNRQRELLDLYDDGSVLPENVCELGELLVGERSVTVDANSIVYYKNNTGMGMQFAATGGLLYQKALQQGAEHEIPSSWFETDLSEQYAQGYFPSS